MKTVGDLKAWLANVNDNVHVELLIETEDCQYAAPMNDVAFVTRNGIEQRYVIIMHEMFVREVERKK